MLVELLDGFAGFFHVHEVSFRGVADRVEQPVEHDDVQACEHGVADVLDANPLHIVKLAAFGPVFTTMPERALPLYRRGVAT